MYLKSLKITNFRKFGTHNNLIEFVDSKSYLHQKEDNDINIAPTTTLIVGKNNAGKTTIINSLDKLINKNGDYKANDFNFLYLKRVLNQYLENSKESKAPYLQFDLNIGIDDVTNDIVTNMVPFMVLDDVESSEMTIVARFECEDDVSFLKNVNEFVMNSENEETRFKKFINLIDDSKFKINYYNVSGDIVNKFSINNLIELKAIKANNIDKEFSLTKAFSTIIKYRFKTLLEEGELDIDRNISDINTSITKIISERHTKDINESLGKIESIDKLKVLLSADLTFQKLLNNLIKYEYIEKENNIPENQFGLGYTNLLMLLADLIDYMEKYPEDSFNSRVNLISIEEPETFMHPQMQELFIKNINEAIATLLKSKRKNINSQLIITTHSSHILNSKVHTGNTFNNINYITINNNFSEVVNLSDDNVVRITKNNLENINKLKFLKKHIKYKVSELFFSDAIIFVEGVTEETILKYYLDNNSNLNKYYISVFNIDGAHGLVYHELINQLKVPALIITDLDIKRSKVEKEEFEQITIVTDRITTNETIKKYSNTEKLEDLPDYIIDKNKFVAYQNEINGYYATSFEEAFILTNYKNNIINTSLQNTKPEIYKNIIGENIEYEKIKENSYKIQRKLSKSKSDFANELLYQLVINEDEKLIPILPGYITNAFEWLEKRLEGRGNNELIDNIGL